MVYILLNPNFTGKLKIATFVDSNLNVLDRTDDAMESGNFTDEMRDLMDKHGVNGFKNVHCFMDMNMLHHNILKAEGREIELKIWHAMAHERAVAAGYFKN